MNPNYASQNQATKLSSHNYLIHLINIQGLSQTKMIDIENLMKSSDKLAIFCVTETQLKRNSIKNSNNIKFIHQMRLPNDKKGGGLALFWKYHPTIDIEEELYVHDDLLFCKCKIKNRTFFILLVYLPFNDDQLSSILVSKITTLLEKYGSENIMLLGDFNGHLGFLGKQKLDSNGKRVLKLTEKFNLCLLNLDDQTEGKFTWT